MADTVWQIAYQGETTAYFWDYKNQPEWQAGQTFTLASPPLVCEWVQAGPGTAADITFGTASITGSQVSAVVSGFKRGNVYVVTSFVNFSGGAGPKKLRGYLECQ